jgi:YesN/AraC family two-component response regulator
VEIIIATINQIENCNNNSSVVDVVATPIHTPTTLDPNHIKSMVNEYINNKFDDGAESVTMKQIQSAIKIRGITCGMLTRICVSLGYDMYAGPTDYCYSSYFVRVN